jgi:hypothetical protein
LDRRSRAIGRRLAGLGAALDMNVVYWSRASRDPNLELLELDDVLSTADVIQICLALKPQTQGLIGHDQFARMKPGVLLINTSRAQTIDHRALLTALSDGTSAATPQMSGTPNLLSTSIGEGRRPHRDHPARRRPDRRDVPEICLGRRGDGRNPRRRATRPDVRPCENPVQTAN